MVVTAEEMQKMAYEISKELREEPIVCPISWGAARDFDTFEQALSVYSIDFPHTRYDVQQVDDIWYGCRKIITDPLEMRKKLESGILQVITKQGIVETKVEPVTFSKNKDYLFFDDGAASGLSIGGSVTYAGYYADVLRPERIYTAVVNDCVTNEHFRVPVGIAYFSCFKEYEKKGGLYLGMARFLEIAVKEAYEMLRERNRLSIISRSPLEDAVTVDLTKVLREPSPPIYCSNNTNSLRGCV